jgi:phosphoribosylglycinamide formyltransferase-1
MHKEKQQIAIFASGSGSNARKIIEYFNNSETIAVRLVVSNKKDAGVLDIAQSQGIETLVVNRADFAREDQFLLELRARNIDYIVLAGFLLLVPAYLVAAFPQRIFNIHPALLPKYGGKGMYGHIVHEAVKAAGDTESGMTIHWVDEHYDEGTILFQARCTLTPDDTPEDIARKVLELEHRYYATVVEQAITDATHDQGLSVSEH